MSFLKLIILMAICVCVFFTWLPGALGQRRRHRNKTTAGLPRDIQQVYLKELRRFNYPTESQPSITNSSQSVPAATSTLSENNGMISSGFPTFNVGDYTPNIPVPDESDCKVEIEVTETQQRNGRCTRLGGFNGPYICQSGPHFDFRPACQEIIENRQRQSSEHTET